MKKKSKYMKPKLELTSSLLARRTFKINGHTIEAGKPFDWKRLSIGWRRVVQLHDARFIVIAEVIEEKAPEAPKAPVIPPVEDIPPAPPEEKTPPPPKQETAEVAPETPASEEDTVYAPEVPSVVIDAVVHHRGGGWYDVLKNGIAVNEKPIRKDEAESLASSVKL